MNKNTYKLPVLILAAAILIVSIVNLALPDRELSENENRYLQQLPKLSVSSILSGDFEEDFQNYINDQLIGRETLLRLKAMFMIYTGTREINSVYIGAGGRLIEAIKPWDVDEKRLLDNTNAINVFFKVLDTSINRSVMIVPTAGYVCAGVLAKFAPMADQKKILDSIRSGIDYGEFFDISDTLISANFSQFYLTDHHWTSDSAYEAYKLWRGDKARFDNYERKTVTKNFKGTLYSKVMYCAHSDKIEIYDSSREFTAVCDTEEKPMFDMKALESKDKYEVFLGGNYSEVKIDAAGKKGKLLIIKDSFANAFTQFAVNDYSEVHLIDLRYYNGNVNQYIANNSITDVLVLYGLDTFITDRNILKLYETS